MRAWNTFKTGLLLATLTGLLVLVGSAIGGRSGMLFAFLFAITMNIGAWWFSDKIALAMNGAHEVSQAEAPDLHRIVDNLARRAGIPKPRVYVVNSLMPNAFATGRDPNHSAVAVTTGIMQTLSYDELAGVIAHELAHIKHRDTLIASVVATIAGAITMIADFARWALFFGGMPSDEDDGGSVVGNVLMVLLAPIAALLIQLAISRSREFTADEGGAQILGNPLPLASALEKLEYAATYVPGRVNPSTSHLFIINPLRGESGLLDLFRTHPNTAERVRRLRTMAVSHRRLAWG
jgi:heat shock protein HtpX